MTAAAGVLTGLAKLKRQDSVRSQQRPAEEERAPRKGKRRTDVVVVRGRLRLFSASGFFLLLGLLILAVGVAMATLGYWPQASGLSGGGPSPEEEESATESSGLSQKTEGRGGGQWRGGALARFLERHRHSERMKMFGPFTMGIGIFIFICANAILHENRDRETKIIHMRDMYSTVIDIHGLRKKAQKQHRHEPGDHDPVAFSSWAEEEEALLAKEEEEEAGRWRARMRCSFAPPLHKDRSSPQRGGHRARSIVSSSITAFTLPVIKVNNCVIDEPDAEAVPEEPGRSGRDEDRSQAPGVTTLSLAVPSPCLARAFKASRLHRSHSASSVSSTLGCWLSPGAAQSDFGSNSSLYMLGSHSKSLDLERRPGTLGVHGHQRKHPSWPRLDGSSCGFKGYARLEGGGGGAGTRPMPPPPLLPPPVVGRDYSKREKLFMISRSHNNLMLERHDTSSRTVKRGGSETRF
ncbi:transmembrane protein 200A [Syngnathus scovelli]|uniref:transmembrane protein 200A n=1 Tax=Syngnathus scovelli TaxID=161590 RepID=UPI00211045C1|nr:transmembrane protein 200A [Syngnathus scovelli]